jgi:four helix bundle protein
MGRAITSHRQLDVFRRAFDLAMRIFELSKEFPKEERYALTDQIRRSSRSVCGNLAEAWRKRRYEAAFVSKLDDAEGEAAETQVWLEFAGKCGYAGSDECRELYEGYDGVLRTLVGMANNTESWLLPPMARRRRITPAPPHPSTQA